MSVRSHTHCSPPRNRSMVPTLVASGSERNRHAAGSRSLSVAVATAVNISRFLDQSSPDYTAPTTLAAMQVLTARDADELAEVAADVFRDRVRARPDLAMAVPAGRTPRRMYARMAALQARHPVNYAKMRIFSVDELCPPAPADGYFWRQVRAEFLAWAGVDAARCRPFAVDAADLEAMCAAFETAIAEAGGVDGVMLGFGANADLAFNEPGCGFHLRTRPGRLAEETVRYILSDDV